ncbi:citrate transporter [Variibacter gotjawalensis]|uniref:Citrate transporter n=1 Tax=Variibacter gotjawalensis TaxID=1333996 RepID=A0A0S3PUN6_9BRAD|nr:sodium:proton antiporter [Variibacter gotjawalensis]NIK49953.1 Na+/H+ antiporter NhaD/arsenite permease-like protein [Variibacter gotjawalensis]RZS45952.1 UIT6 family transporter [Variibacter gotjawalensis]BAT59627.1 citrate transporter [Variibacter gotjawalensis]
MTFVKVISLALAASTFSLAPAFAADGLDGAGMSVWWALPFLGLLLSIATGPLFYPHVWEHHYGKFSAFWAACVIVPLVLIAGATNASHAVAHTVLLEYVPFILLLTALFVTAGGIFVQGNLHGTPATNTALLAIGAGMASVVGTTGASIIMIRPLLRANDDRVYRVHTVVFFIFLVSNVGGSLTPLGDPPLFVGFLKGVDFFWTTTHLALPMLLVGGIVLAVFVVFDTVLYRREAAMRHPKDPTPDEPLRLHGLINIPLLGVIIGAILLSASWKPGVSVTILGATLELQTIVRDVIFIVVAIASLWLTDKESRTANGFNWHPIQEVALLFAGIFVCIVPVIAMLQAGRNGAFAPLVALVTNADGAPNNLAYFWLTGILSSFLDNAPTYLVFFELAGGDAKQLMGPLATTLGAISAGAVFMGANSYIGNAPNFMVYAIARQGGVAMPSFFGYTLWSSAILLPTFVLCGWLFYR